MDLYIVRRPSAWTDLKDFEKVGARAASIGDFEMTNRVRWIRSYCVREQDGRVGTFCMYEARDEESIREHARRAGMPGDEIYPVTTTIVMRADPMDRSQMHKASLLEMSRA